MFIYIISKPDKALYKQIASWANALTSKQKKQWMRFSNIRSE
jgi:uncharacterized pyridoxamine 5'-phosphate oxidase family protein